jgi:hypothetical protein
MMVGTGHGRLAEWRDVVIEGRAATEGGPPSVISPRANRSASSCRGFTCALREPLEEPLV